MEDNEEKVELRVGKLYHVRFDDCCVSGEFTDRLLLINGQEYPKLVFEHIVIESYLSHAVEFQLVEE